MAVCDENLKNSDLYGPKCILHVFNGRVLLRILLQDAKGAAADFPGLGKEPLGCRAAVPPVLLGCWRSLWLPRHCDCEQRNALRVSTQLWESLAWSQWA